MAPGSENKIKLWPRDFAKVCDSEMAIFDHFYKFTQDYTNIFQKHKVQTLIKVLKVFKVFRVLILQVLSLYSENILRKLMMWKAWRGIGYLNSGQIQVRANFQRSHNIIPSGKSCFN